MTSPETVVRVLAEPTRLRAYAAVVLGAGTLADIAAASGLTVKDAGTALRKLREAGLVEGEPARPADLKALAATLTERMPADGLAPFVRGDKLVSLPVAADRRRKILEHVASKAFVAQTYYEEKEINERLRAWCDGGELDHVTIRRYLVDLGLLERGGGLYQAKQSPPLPM
ncbi:DUF2087 domain-containing protein [Lentzea sp. NPDC051213]|uniref:DUF2087 domain-containing protein n=1 Tax=Lentzea sp. NPDC051213 TaxID=3364126 RepID=UPI0037A15522